MIVFTSTPRARSASDWSSACSTTAPQNDHEYGTTIPTFIAAIIVGRAVHVRSPHDREILRLALPALGALAAEPLYVLVDTAIVGHLGRPQLAALGLAAAVLGGAFTIFNFLAYGTTAVVARASGAGQEERAARLAAQALWVALAIGLGLVVGLEATAGPLLRGLGGHGRSGDFALTVLPDRSRRPAAAMVAVAGQGYLRGVSNLRRPFEIVVVANVANIVLELLFVYGFHWGIAGSAAGTAIAQAGMGVAFVVELLRPHADSRRPSLTEMRPMMRIGGQIFVRTTALIAAFLAASSVAARMGDAVDRRASDRDPALLLPRARPRRGGDRRPGDRRPDARRGRRGRRVRGGCSDDRVVGRARRRVRGGAAARSAHVVPRAFSSDADVLTQAALLWPFFALMQPLGGAVFALDGILIGAGDTASISLWCDARGERRGAR